MRWKGRRQSENVEDRRGQRRAGPMLAAGGGGIGVLLMVLFVAFMGGDPSKLLQQMQQQGGAGGANVQPGAVEGGAGPPAGVEDEMREFVSVVLADTEDVWNQILPTQGGMPYRKPKLVIFSGVVDSACGAADAAVGPFYCPGDSNVYIDLTFYDQLKHQLGAPGDFAQAYVIAHEVGHHVQNLMGISDEVRRAQSGMSKAEANDLSVRLELQADFFAGVWAHHAQKRFKILEAGDLKEALNAATAIGDDKLQREGQGYVVPDSFTHGTSEQRVRWFSMGFESGDLREGNTFEAQRL